MPDRQPPRLVGVPRRFTPEQERRRLERQIKALETLKARGWWRAVVIEVAVISLASVTAFSLLAYLHTLADMPLLRVAAALGLGLLIGMSLRRPWQTARLVFCGSFILVVGFLLAAIFEGGDVPLMDLPVNGGESDKENEESTAKRRVDDAIARRLRRLGELGP